MEWWRFLFWNAAGGICWATAVGLVAYYSGHAAADAIQRYGIYAAGGIALALVIAWFATHTGKKWLERRL
jgi:membrane protein DedA with SNARE-associated domain